MTYSGLTGDNVEQLWATIVDHRNRMTKSGELAARRREQQVKWMWAMFDDRLRETIRTDRGLSSRLPEIEKAVAAGTLSPAVAVDEIAQALGVRRP